MKKYFYGYEVSSLILYGIICVQCIVWTQDLSHCRPVSNPLDQPFIRKVWQKKLGFTIINTKNPNYFCAGNLNVEIFKTLTSRRNYLLQRGNPNSFATCSGASKVYVARCFLHSGVFFYFQWAKIVWLNLLYILEVCTAWLKI